MRTFATTVLLLAALSYLASADMSTPLTSLGSANAHGKLQLWINVDEADYGNELVLPVRITFESGDEYQSKILGRGFWFPLLEARAYPYNEQLMQVELLCGKTIYLRKDLKNTSQYYTANRQVTGTIDGNKFILKQEDGWELRYKNGKIWQAQTDKGRVLTWYYLNSIAAEIKEERGGNSALKLEWNPNGKVNGVSINGKLHSFELGKKPRVEYIDNKKAVGAMDESLNVWVYPDGKKDTYEFAVTKELEPTLTRTDKDGTSKMYQWEAKRGFIVSDGDWRYKIEPNGQLPKLRRYNEQGQEEFRIADNRNGIVVQKKLEEENLITESYRTPGPLYDKVRKIERVDADGTKKPFFQATYDEQGKMLRSVTTDAKGYATTFNYNGQGKIKRVNVSLPTDAKFLASLRDKEKELIKKVKAAAGSKDEQEIVRELASFYLFELLNLQKAAEVIAGLDHMHGYALRVQMIDNNHDFNPLQKVSRYEDLLKTYPECKEDLDFLIKIRKEETKQWEINL